MPLLEVKSVSKSFEGFRALTDLSLAVEEGAFHALVGPNGAGKSTLFNVIIGRYRPDNGRVIFDTRDITDLPTHRIVPYGIGVSFQRAIPFASITVLENVALALLALGGAARDFVRPLWTYRAAVKGAEEVLSWVGLLELKNEPTFELSLERLKRVDIAIALVGKPRLLLLDEPLAGLSRAGRAQMVTFIQERLRPLGVTLLFTEHDTEAVMQLADRIMVLQRGRALAEGPPDYIRGNPAVLDAYLGREA